MKSKLVLVGALLVPTGLYALRTFFSMPVPFHPASVERQTMSHNQLRDYTYEPYNGLSVTCFGGKSTCPDKLASYLLPFGKSCLVAGGFGSNAVNEHYVDLLAQYFNVLNGHNARAGNLFDDVNSWTFESTLQFHPEHSFWGLGFLYHRALSASPENGFWLEVALPVMGVKNDFGMCETRITPTVCDETHHQSFFSANSDSYAYPSMTCALRSSQFQYGRIDAREYCKAKWGVADLEFRLGYTFCREEKYHLDGYAGVFLPTGNVPNATYLFEKVIGYNGHTGLFLGALGGIKLWQHNQNFLTFEAEAAQTIFFDKTEVRSFDPYGKPWGRYIWVYPSTDTQVNLAPGINYFTKAVDVSHGSLCHVNVAAVYNTTNFQGELGYHCYTRGAEQVCLTQPWTQTPAFAAIWYSDNSWVGSQDRRVSRSGAAINAYPFIHNDAQIFQESQDKSNDTYVPITACQLDLESAAHPAIVMHTIYLSLGYGWFEQRVPTFINIASGYAFGCGNAVLNNWQLWLKGGLEF